MFQQADAIDVVAISLLETVSMKGRFIYDLELSDEFEVEFLSPVYIRVSDVQEPIRARAFLANGKHMLVHSEHELPSTGMAQLWIDPTLRWSNKQFVKEIYPEFSKWLEETESLWNDFCRLDFSLREYLRETLFPYTELCNTTAGMFRNVRENCDNIDYSAKEVTLAYIILHFLDRYYRFQITWQHLLSKGLLPIRILPIDILDVGTGPAPSLFALSDSYALLQEFGRRHGISRLSSLKFSTNYVERSVAFREWLGSFTSFISRNIEISTSWVKYYHATSIDEYKPHSWNIPGEFGSFWDARELNFQSLKQGLQQEEISKVYNTTDLDWLDAVATVQGWIGGWKDELRYNLIIFSNFITQPEQVPQLKSLLHSAYRSLRNGGMIVLVGGPGQNYETIYKEVENSLQGLAKNHLIVYRTPLSYRYSDHYASALRHLRGFVLDEFERIGAAGMIEEKTWRKLNEMRHNLKGSCKWTCVVFKKLGTRKRN